MHISAGRIAMMHADTAERHHGYQGRIIKKKEVQMQGNHFADGLLLRMVRNVSVSNSRAFMIQVQSLVLS